MTRPVPRRYTPTMRYLIAALALIPTLALAAEFGMTRWRPTTAVAAIVYTLIETAKLNGVDPQAWLTDSLASIADHKITKLDEPMPCRYAQH